MEAGWSNASPRQGPSRINSAARKKPGKVSEGGETTGVTLILDFWPPELEATNFCCCNSPSWWLYYSSPRELITTKFWD